MLVTVVVLVRLIVRGRRSLLLMDGLLVLEIIREEVVVKGGESEVQFLLLDRVLDENPVDAQVI